jgi:DNA-binding PadR family transcriptional regulator
VLHRGNFHPYEIKRRLENAMVECYTDVDVGTLYYAIRQLARDGRIAARSRERVARGGIRTVYAITPKGRRRFQQLLRAQFETPGPVADTLYGALLFLYLSDLPTLAPLLRARIRRQTEAIREFAAAAALMAPLAPESPRHFNSISMKRNSKSLALMTLCATPAPRA